MLGGIATVCKCDIDILSFLHGECVSRHFPIHPAEQNISIQSLVSVHLMMCFVFF